MNINKKLCFLVLFFSLSLLSITSHCAIDPIGWKLNQLFQNPVYTGRTYSVTYTLTNQLPFQLVKPLLITKNASSQNEFSYDDKCSGVRLASKASCTVKVILTPRTSGSKQLQLTVGGYDNNQVKLPPITARAVGTLPTGIISTVTQALPYQMSPGNSVPYSFVFTNRGKTTATQIHTTITQSNGTPNIITNTCMNGSAAGTLAAGASCTIAGSYTPNSDMPSMQSVAATLTYKGSTGSPLTETTSTEIIAPAGDIVGSLVIPNYLPPLLLTGTAYPIQVLFTNVSGSQVTLGSQGTMTCIDSNSIDCTANLGTITSYCNASLPATAACQLQASLTLPSSPTPGTTYTVSASLSYTGTGSPATISTAGTYVTSLPTTRTINLVNQCNFPVWFSLNGSAVTGVSCNAQGNGCPAGTSCNTSTLSCYWNNPGPNSGTSYRLAKNGGSNSVTIPSINYGGIQWSGNISASTLCSGTSCAQAACNNQGGTTSCSPGKGFSQPATQAEITMSANNNDSYDVEVINGFHIPISMAPFFYTNIPATANNYNCGTPGSYTAVNNFGACNWNTASLPAPNNGTGFSSGYYWVSNGSKTCNINSAASQCPTGQLCGLYQNPSTNAFSQTCGKFLGYWSADQVCSNTGLSSTVSNFFKCTMSLPTTSPSFPANATLYNLMACAVPSGDVNPLYNSCYLSYPGASAAQIETCCGCVDWWNSTDTSGAIIQSNSSTQSCGTQVDPIWTKYIQPMVQWMKATCPSAYVYPFDDKTSGFSCTNNLPNQPNSTGYTITFCEGNTGLPTGISDGRGS